MIGHEGYSTTLLAGSAEYMAPELSPEGEDTEEQAGSQINEPLFSKMSDIYAFSMLAFEVRVVASNSCKFYSSDQQWYQQIFTDRTPLQKGSKGSKPNNIQSFIIVNWIRRGVRPKRVHDYN